MEEDKILQYFWSEREKTANLRDEMNKDLGEKQIDFGKQKLEFLKFIPVLSGAMLGFLPFIGQPNTNLYLYLGVGINLFLIIFALAYLRESLDEDSNALQRLQDRYNILLDGKINLAEKFFAVGNNSEISVRQYQEKLLELPGVKSLDEDVKKADYQRRNRHKQELNYAGEFIVFLFTTGLLFLMANRFGFPVNLCWTLSIILLPLILSFSRSTILIVKLVSKIANFLIIRNERVGKKSTED